MNTPKVHLKFSSVLLHSVISTIDDIIGFLLLHLNLLYNSRNRITASDLAPKFLSSYFV